MEETGIYSPVGIVEEFDRAIREELDFLHEADNVRAFQATHASRPAIRIPAVYEALSSPTVLTLEFLDGVRLLDADLDPEQKAALARAVVDTSFRQLFVDGLFHGDPHPGNFLLLPGDVVALLDFGLVGRLSRQMREQLVLLCVAVALKDADSVARLLYRLGGPEGRASLSAFRSDVDGLLNRHLPRTLGEVDARNLLIELLDLAVKYGSGCRGSTPPQPLGGGGGGHPSSALPDLDILAVALPTRRTPRRALRSGQIRAV